MASKIVKKIKKLLALSRNNPSVEEATAAAAKAAELMRLHDIEIAEDIEAHRVSAIRAAVSGQNSPEWFRRITRAVAHMYGTRAVRYLGGVMVIEGLSDDVHAAVATLEFITNQVKRITTAERKRRGGRGAALRKHMSQYRDGVSLAVSVRIVEAHNARQKDALPSTGLVVHKKHIIAQQFGGVVTEKAPRPRHSQSAISGAWDGRRVKVAEEVG